MHYVIYAEDHPDSLEKRRSVREAHLKRVIDLEKQGRLLIAGPMPLQDQDVNLSHGVRGSVIIAEFNSLEDAKAWAAADPYSTAEVYQRITVSPFKKVLPEDE